VATFTPDARGPQETLARLRACDGKASDAVVVVWERAQELAARHDALAGACARSLRLLEARLDLAEILDEEKQHIDELRAALRGGEAP
jgi:hypothetical protein